MNTYTKRRIMVALIITLISTASFFTVKAVGNVLSEPTFTCIPGEVRLGHQMLWNIADTYCSGHITDAAMYIMKTNNIEGKDLRQLLPSTIIVIKGGN
jgi:hypothetical protein